jgi:uncharacterized delta-60 repeat protein
MRVNLAIVACLASSVFAAGAALAAPAELDRGFGRRGVLDLSGLVRQAPLERLPVGYAPGRGNSGYLLVRGPYECGRRTCVSRGLFVARVLARGRVDPHFGEDGYAQAFEGSISGYGFTTDGRGRPVVAAERPGRIEVRRLRSNGRSDPTFGGSGTAAIRVDLGGAGVQVAVDSGERVLIGGEHATSAAGPSFLLARLRPDGRLDRGFAGGGHRWLRSNRDQPALGFWLEPSGAILFERVHEYDHPSLTLIRLRADGRRDRSFGRSGHPLRFGRIPGAGPIVELVSPELVPRPGGTVDVIGAAGPLDENGYIRRLRPNGVPDRRFGPGGFRLYATPFEEGALDGRGRMVAIGAGARGRVVASRVLADGRPDRGFAGGRGKAVPVSEIFNAVLSLQPTERIDVFDRGVFECREVCPPDPRLVRLRGGGR